MSMGLGPAVALVAILLAGCAGPIGPDPEVPTGRIDGAVVGPLLSPYANLGVRLVELDRVDHTSDLGGFTFRNVPEGVWTLEAQYAGTKGAVATVTVVEGEITPIILQLFPVDPPPGVLETLQQDGSASIATAGAECEDCAWRIPLTDDPHEVVIRATWEDDAGRSSTLRIDVYDSDGDFIRSLEGPSPLRGTILGRDIPNGERGLRLAVHFGPDFLPQVDFQMETTAEIYYDATRAQYLDQQ
jgi:hypothetical protein